MECIQQRPSVLTEFSLNQEKGVLSLTLSQTTIFGLFQTLRDNNSEFDKNGSKFSKSNFSLSHGVFKRFVLQTLKHQDLFREGLNLLPNHKILDKSELKALADNKIKVTEKLDFVLGRIENIVGKGENAGNQHFLLFPQCFQKAFYVLFIQGH